MSEFLKEYHLYQDMTRLNNQEYFAVEFQVPDILQFLSSVTPGESLKHVEKTLKILLLNLRIGNGKSVYVMLKWLLCMHRSIDSVGNERLLERIYEALSKMESPKVEGKEEVFILEGMARPYVQFLAKKCLLRLQESQKGEEDKENQTQAGCNLLFMRYNLLRHSIGELAQTTVDLHGYFQACYPLLASISSLLHNDLCQLLKQVQIGVKTQHLKTVNQQDLTDIQLQIDRLQPNQHSQSYLSIDEGQLSYKLTFFMQTDQKQPAYFSPSSPSPTEFQLP